MTLSSLLQLFQGPSHFLHREAAEVRRLIPQVETTLPVPWRIFLNEESSTPFFGFPVYVSPGMKRLNESLERYIQVEEEAQLRILQRDTLDRKALQQAWETYRGLFSRAVENLAVSSYGRQYPGIFWLQHSLELARLLKETPRRMMRLDLEGGRTFGDQIKYRVLERYLDRTLNTTYDVVSRLAVDTEEAEEELFPSMLIRMRDNVLILTEDHISRDLGELNSYFSGYLRIDGRDLRERFERLEAWHRQRLEEQPDAAAEARHLLGIDPETSSRSLLTYPGYATYLSGRADYDPRRLLEPAQVKVWESLLTRLKEFELLQNLRLFLTPVERRDGHWVYRASKLRRRTEGPETLVLSPSTRPMNFMAAWVVDPIVQRFGLIYDLTDFSEIISVLRRSGTEIQDESFRKMFRFQRRISRIARLRSMKLEKYLGDGAFFSSHNALPTLLTALHIQRGYREELTQGFPFDRGLRIALNYGRYRLIPIGRGRFGEPERYEFFGHGLVELSRLTTGKKTLEIEEIKTLLVNYGYPEPAVYKFFSPLLKEGVETMDRKEHSRPFFAYVNPNGSLINEGMVATETFISELDRDLGATAFHRIQVDGRPYLIFHAEEPSGERFRIGLRRLGPVRLKGLDQTTLFEIIDAEDLMQEEQLGTGVVGAGLLESLHSAFGVNLGASGPGP